MITHPLYATPRSILVGPGLLDALLDDDDLESAPTQRDPLVQLETSREDDGAGE